MGLGFCWGGAHSNVYIINKRQMSGAEWKITSLGEVHTRDHVHKLLPNYLEEGWECHEAGL